MYSVKVKRTNPYAELPTKGTTGAAGFDVYAAADYLVPARGRKLIQTGWNIQTPPGTEVQVRPRSGLALKEGITVLNSPGTVDEDYQGPLGVILFNTTDDPYIVARGDRVAQIVVKEVPPAEMVEVTDFAEVTDRGAHGFGSTGA